MQFLGKLSAIAFGSIMILLSIVITFETIIRKLFSISLGGVDELSGYAVAIGAFLAFAIASLEHSLIRITLLYVKLPRRTQAILNAVAALAVAILAVSFLVFAIGTLQDTIAYKSIAQTPWATPLIYPQFVWVVTSTVFAIVATVLVGRAGWLLLRGDTATLTGVFGPERVEDEVATELQSLKQR